MTPLKNKCFFVAMRHEKSIAATYGFVSGLGASISEFQSLVLERHKDSSDVFDAKKETLFTAIREKSFDALILATKVNDVDNESQLIPFLEALKAAGLAKEPVILTHLSSMEEEGKTALKTLGLNVFLVENDNLGFPKPTDAPTTKRTGLSQLGKVILDACATRS